MKQTNKTEFVRVEKTKNYTVIHNQFLKRKDLSWKAKGILAYVLSLPDDWNINLNELMKHATDGEASLDFKVLKKMVWLISSKGSKGDYPGFTIYMPKRK